MTTEILLTLSGIFLWVLFAGANLWHWCGYNGAKFFYVPVSGLGKTIYTLSTAIMIISGILSLTTAIPTKGFIAIVILRQIAVVLYSIWYRRTHQPHLKKAQPVRSGNF